MRAARSLAPLLLLAACSEYDLKGNGGAPAGDGPAPDIAVIPSSIDFGTLAVGEVSEARLATVSNVGDADLNLWEVALSDADGAFAVGSLGASLLAPGASVDVAITFSPRAAGSHSGSLDVSSDDPDEPRLGVGLTGRTLSPDLVLDPLEHDFGTLAPFATADLSVSLSNQGDAPLTVRALDYSATSDELSFDALEEANGALPWLLEVGESRLLSVHYAPVNDTPDEGFITASSDDPAEPEAIASQIGNGVNLEDFESRCLVYDDGVAYETTSNPAYVVDSHGDADLYWYEPSGAHGMVGSSDPTTDFAILRQYVLDRGAEVDLSGGISFDSGSSLSTFAYATYTYVLCDFYLRPGDDPASYTVSTGTVDDGIEVILNGAILGTVTLGSTGSFTLSGASGTDRNTLVVILVDDSASNRYLHDLRFLRDGAPVD